MAHFAKISEENIVLQVLTLDDKDMLNGDNIQTESIGQAYLTQHNNWPTHLWIQTSYDTVNNTHKNGGTALRGNYAGVGHTWDEGNQIFWYPQPHASWVKNLSTAQWNSPIGDAPALTAEQNSQNNAKTNYWFYVWNESGQSWDLTDSNEQVN
jgi:hypothetical protein